MPFFVEMPLATPAHAMACPRLVEPDEARAARTFPRARHVDRDLRVRDIDRSAGAFITRGATCRQD